MTQKILEALLGELRAGLEAVYGERLKGLYLYGSYARGEADSESDVDVIVVLDKFDHYGGELDRTSVLVSTVSLKYALSVSRVFVREQEWLRSETPFLANAREEAIPA
jgi:predicted nucleotidyltransferase